jgi:hypothetical protein
MTLVRDKYRSLAPRAEYLHDVVVLSQAWKKAHTYIRRHNWYADTLELDCSAVDLESKLREWSELLKEGDGFSPTPACLVPAPKNGPWIFSPDLPGGWGPRPSGDEQPGPVLRPLAHLGIREQTISTAVMLCLADCIESAQGNPAASPEEAAARGVYSYGNRLYCRWTDGDRRARFAWGNSTTYSRFFQDYQQFVERPNAIARRVDAESGDDVTVYVVKLDLSAFYDNIDLSRLVDCLKREYSTFRRTDRSLPLADAGFWKLARKVLDFSWRTEDQSLAHLFRDGVLPHGLPQGLVASGFLANAYMLDFDRAIGDAAQRGCLIQGDITVQIHDYCRYVDDLRIVVSTSCDDDPESHIHEMVSEWVQKQLKEKTAPKNREKSALCINSKKTEVESYSAVGGESGTSARMKLLQQQLSGPFDTAALLQVEAGLNGLLALAELGLSASESDSNMAQLSGLASIAKPKLEVRDDTLTRFSAYRLTKSLRLRRAMTDMTEQDGVLAKEALRHDFEVTARRLVASWSSNPSLVQVLRYALDLFPSPELLSPVAFALTTKLNSHDSSLFEKRVAFYVLAELFRAGAMETGLRAARDQDFQIGDVGAYREALVTLARSMLKQPDVPWYVMQQASLLLATVGHATSNIPLHEELRLSRTLHEFLLNQSKRREVTARDEVAVSLVGHKLRGDKKGYVTWFKQYAFGRQKKDVADALLIIGQADQDLFVGITKRGNGKKAAEAGLMPKYLGEYIDARWPRNALALPNNTWISFAQVITHPSDVFNQENALLQLAFELSKLSKRALKNPELLTPLALYLRCENWSRLNEPSSGVLKLQYRGGPDTKDPIYATPDWCSRDKAWMYAFGRLLRAAATGELDFTVRQWLFRDELGWYSGIRSTWQNRRMGMTHTSTALVGTTSAITPWFSNMLLGLLRWPGIADGHQVSELESASMPSDFGALIHERIRFQAALYGRSSGLPVYRYPVDWPLRENRHLRIVQVQGLMPSHNELLDGIAALSSPGYRARHRNHTASLLNLAYRKIMARDSVFGTEHRPQVDVVIFPELAVHVDDQDLMRAFSDATGAMLFYGLLGATTPGVSGPVNAARWLVPQRRGGRRSWVEVDQGKWHLTSEEHTKLGIEPWRPYQVVIELRWGDEPGYRISGAVCYDATDISLAADLKDETHMFVVAAMNRDVKTFDSMVSALRYHMYQHVLIANSGEFGGSTAQAPYDQEHKRLVSHVHGSNQIAVSIFEVCVDDFGPNLAAADEGKTVLKNVKERIGKTPPAGLSRRKPKVGIV